MPTPQKEEIVVEVAEAIKNAQAVIFTDYRGLTVLQVSELRKKLRDSDTTFSVVKNTLFKRAAEGILPENAELDATLNGPTAVAFANRDAVESAKAFMDYVAATRNTPLKIKGAMVSGKFYNAQQVDALSKVPPRPELIAAILGSINAPVAGLVYTLDSILSSLVFTLTAVVDQKQAEA